MKRGESGSYTLNEAAEKMAVAERQSSVWSPTSAILRHPSIANKGPGFIPVTQGWRQLHRSHSDLIVSALAPSYRSVHQGHEKTGLGKIRQQALGFVANLIAQVIAAPFVRRAAEMSTASPVVQAESASNSSTTSSSILTLTGTPSGTSSSASASNTSANVARLTKADPKIIAIVSVSTLALCVLIGIAGYFVRRSRGRWARSDDRQNDVSFDDDDDDDDDYDDSTVDGDESVMGKAVKGEQANSGCASLPTHAEKVGPEDGQARKGQLSNVER